MEKWPDSARVIERVSTWAAAYSDLTGVLVDVPELLFKRAELARLGPRGRVSAGGSCRLLRAADGWVAVNLARPTDREALPALLGGHASLESMAAAAKAAEIADRAQLVEIPAAALGAPAPRDVGPVAGRVSLAGVHVVDLSAMWAGPLCGRLLRLAGARVTKVESPDRPDGARFGPAGFYSWLHQGQGSRVVPVGEFAAIIEEADVVIESSRPRALRGLGIVAEEFGGTWVSITGYGRASNRTAFGDDTAVAGGLVARDARGDPLFCGDAIADPITGLMAALEAIRAHSGGGGLVEIVMRDCAAAC
jgi:hypothetical protein